MLKIKFNMMFNCDQIQIRMLENLRNNFFVEDVLRSFDDGILERWLDARYYTHELKAVKELKASGITNACEILEGLIHIFGSDMKTDEIDSELSVYDYLEERQKFWEYVKDNVLNELEALRKKVKALEAEIYAHEEEQTDEEDKGIFQEYQEYKGIFQEYLEAKKAIKKAKRGI